MISTSLLFTIFADDHSYLWQSVINEAFIDEWLTYSGVYLCKRTIFWTFTPNPNVCLRFCDQKKIKCRLDWIVEIKFGLRPNIWSDLEDQTEFWTDREDKTERLSSLDKFMQIRTQTEVWSKNKVWSILSSNSNNNSNKQISIAPYASYRGAHCVPKTRDHLFDDKLNWNWPFTEMFGTLITKTIGHRQVFLFSRLTYFVQLLYLEKLSRPKYHE